MARKPTTKNYSVWFKVTGFKELKVDYVEAKSVREALDVFEASRPFAVVQSIS